MRNKVVFTVTGKLQELLFRVDGLILEKAVKVCKAYEQSTKQVKEFKDNSNPSNASTKVNKVAQKPDPRVPRNKKPDNKHAKKGNEGMKINCNFCVISFNARKAERNVLLGGRHVTVVKVEIISSPNARRYMQCSSSKIVMKITMTSGSWL